MMKTYDLAEVWIRFTEKFSESASAQVMDTWINPIMPLEVTDEYCKVAVKNSFFKRFIEEKYSKTIESILSSIMEKNIRLIIEAPEQVEETQTIPEIKVAAEPIKPLFNVEIETVELIGKDCILNFKANGVNSKSIVDVNDNIREKDNVGFDINYNGIYLFQENGVRVY